MTTQQPDSEQKEQKYEHALRVIGRHLESEAAHGVRVEENEDGFTVSYHPGRQESELRVVHFTWTRLQDLSIYQSGGRGVARKHERRYTEWSKYPGGHEEFFRTLGYAVDRDRGSELQAEELPDYVAVTYTAPDADGSRKRTLRVGEKEILDLIAEARGRRGWASRPSESQPDR